MKLFFSKGACSLAARIIINEIGIDAKFEEVDLKTKKTVNGVDFLKINPKGAVPTLQISADKILTENAVILQYLAEDTHTDRLLPPVGDFKRYRELEWLNFIATDLHKNFAPLFNMKLSDELKNTIFKPILKAKFNVVDKHLADHEFMMGDEFTLPDAYFFVMLTWTHKFKIDLQEDKNLTRYFDALKKRPSIAKSLKQEDLSF